MMKDGRIVARQVKTLHDTGAYAGMGPYAVEKNSILVAGPYNIPNIAYRWRLCIYEQTAVQFHARVCHHKRHELRWNFRWIGWRKRSP